MNAGLTQPSEAERADIPPDSSALPRVALLFVNFGFYHIARLRALRRTSSVRPIEFAGEQKLYGWITAKCEEGIETLHSGALEDMSLPDTIRSCSRLWRTLQRIKPSHVLIPGYVGVHCYAAAAWAIVNRSRSIMMYDSTEQDMPRNRVKEAVKGAIIRLMFADAFVSGRRTADYLRRLGFTAGRIVPKYDVVDNNFFEQGASACRQTSAPLDWDLPQNYFLYVGRLAEEKNVAGLLSAFERYRNLAGTWHLVLVGRGALESQLREIAVSKNLEKLVHFMGFKNGAEMFPYYSFAGCFVLPSTREPWGLVVNEAMASSLPILASDMCGCVPDLIESGMNGYSFPPDRPEALADLMLRISSLPLTARLEMGAASHRIIANYSPADWASSVCQLIA